MKNAIKPLCLAGLLTASPLAISDTILGIYAGGGVWQTDFSGKVGDTDMPQADLGDLGLDEEDNDFYFVALEHPVPLIPNIRLQHNSISMSDRGTITQQFVLEGETYSFNENVVSDFDFSHTDATLYYELLDNWVNLDLGLTFRMFDGDVSIRRETTGESSSRDFDETVPMLYGKAQFDLPLTGFYAAVSGNYVSYAGNNVSDFHASLGYMSDGLVLDFGAELGLRNFSVELDDVSDLDADLELDGPFASVYLHF